MGCLLLQIKIVIAVFIILLFFGLILYVSRSKESDTSTEDSRHKRRNSDIDNDVSQESSSGPSCNEDLLMSYLAQIQAVTPESIINLSTEDDLEVVCRKVQTSLDHIDTYFKFCSQQEHDLYFQLTKGVYKLNDKLCSKTKFQIKFESHLDCFKNLHDDLQDCDGPADWIEDTDASTVCKNYNDISHCYYVKTAKLCGKKGAALIRELTEAIMSSVLTIKCHRH